MHSGIQQNQNSNTFLCLHISTNFRCWSSEALFMRTNYFEKVLGITWKYLSDERITARDFYVEIINWNCIFLNILNHLFIIVIKMRVFYDNCWHELECCSFAANENPLAHSGVAQMVSFDFWAELFVCCAFNKVCFLMAWTTMHISKRKIIMRTIVLWKWKRYINHKMT